MILSGLLLLAIGVGLVVASRRSPGRHRAPPEHLKLRPAHARPTPRRLAGNLVPARPHRLVAQDAALSRR